MAASIRKFLSATLFEYETQKVIAISSYKIGLIYRGIQMLIVTYVVGWVMLREKGYQSFDTVVSGVTTKLKGLEYTNYTNIPSVGDRIWDVADWAVPPQMNSAFFVTTNVVITRNQSQTTCEEDKDNKWHSSCKKHSDCLKGGVHMLGWGVKTGRCVSSSREGNLSVCEIYGWCPTEQDILPLGEEKVLMTRVKNFTVLIKNSVEFPKFGIKRRNILSSMTKNYLRSCHYRPDHPVHKYCPIFKLGDIIKYGQAISLEDARQVWITGGMVAIDIHWECNFDKDEDACKPEYKFRNLEDGQVGRGWNFRHAYHYVENGIHKRTLVKAYGIQFFISVTGRGGKFDILNFTMNLGSGLALLTLATVLCDIIVLNIMRKRKKYRQAKIDKVKRKEIARNLWAGDSRKPVDERPTAPRSMRRGSLARKLSRRVTGAQELSGSNGAAGGTSCATVPVVAHWPALAFSLEPRRFGTTTSTTMTMTMTRGGANPAEAAAFDGDGCVSATDNDEDEENWRCPQLPTLMPPVALIAAASATIATGGPAAAAVAAGSTSKTSLTAATLRDRWRARDEAEEEFSDY